MTRTIAWTVRVAPALAAALLASAAQAQTEPAPNPAYPPGYPVGPPSGAPGSPAAGQPPPVDVPPEDQSQDSGLGLEWVWLNADAGFAYADLGSLSQSSLGLQKTASSGPVVGGGIGARLLFMTFGVRARDLMLSNIGDLWEIGAEAAFHLRIWHIDPYFGVRGGYNFVGTLNQNSVGNATGNTSPSVSVHGFNIGPMIGIDYYFAHWISLGADFDAQFLFLQRPPVALPSGVTNAQGYVSSLPKGEQAQANLLYNNSGSSAGIQISPTLHLGIHF
jgi:hypothetical protein